MSVALNTVTDSVTAAVDHAPVTVAGAVVISASNTATITATPVGRRDRRGRLADGGIAGAVALAGAVAINNIATSVSATIVAGNVVASSVSVHGDDHAHDRRDARSRQA